MIPKYQGGHCHLLDIFDYIYIHGTEHLPDIPVMNIFWETFPTLPQLVDKFHWKNTCHTICVHVGFADWQTWVYGELTTTLLILCVHGNSLIKVYTLLKLPVIIIHNRFVEFYISLQDVQHNIDWCNILDPHVEVLNIYQIILVDCVVEEVV